MRREKKRKKTRIKRKEKEEKKEKIRRGERNGTITSPTSE